MLWLLFWKKKIGLVFCEAEQRFLLLFPEKEETARTVVGV
jgi:hypothetical protein